MKPVLFALAAVIMAAPANVVAGAEPEGWQALVEALRATPLNDVESLRGRTFDLVVSDARPTDLLTVRPEAAFRVDRVSRETFRVTVVETDSLIQEGLLRRYRPIEWQLVQGGPAMFDVGIEGRVSCRYFAEFKQKNADVIDLSKMGSAYNVTWEVDNTAAIRSVTPEGIGLAILRRPDVNGEARIRLRLKAKTGPEDISSDWVAIPRCNLGSSQQPPVIIADPPQQPAIDNIVIEVESISTCDDCGTFFVTVNVKATNIGNRFVRCEGMTWSLVSNGTVLHRLDDYWVGLNPGGTTTYSVELQTTPRPAQYSVQNTRGNCFYLP